MIESLEPALYHSISPIQAFQWISNSPSKSLKGVLLIFTQERRATKFTRDTEEFYNAKITKVEVTV